MNSSFLLPFFFPLQSLISTWGPSSLSLPPSNLPILFQVWSSLDADLSCNVRSYFLSFLIGIASAKNAFRPHYAVMMFISYKIRVKFPPVIIYKSSSFSGQTKQFFGQKVETERDPPQKAKISAEMKFRPKFFVFAKILLSFWSCSRWRGHTLEQKW